jgi:hypothetical protein
VEGQEDLEVDQVVEAEEQVVIELLFLVEQK